MYLVVTSVFKEHYGIVKINKYQLHFFPLPQSLRSYFHKEHYFPQVDIEAVKILEFYAVYKES